MRVVVAGLIVAGCAAGQQPVPVYEDARVRIFDVRIEPKSDYVRTSLAGDHIQFSRGAVIHTPREVVIELLQRQSAPKNVCSEILLGEFLHCHEPGPEWLGANLEIQFETEQTRIGIVETAPGATLAIPPADVPPVLIALEGTEAEAVSRANGASPGSGSRRNLRAANVLREPADHITEIRSTGQAAARFLVVEFGGPGE
jgi:hypothetical protein